MAVNADTSAVAAVWYSLLGGKFPVRLHDGCREPGHRYGDVLDEAGTTIGSAHDYIYGGRGWAVHTKPFAGYVPDEQIVIVE